MQPDPIKGFNDIVRLVCKNTGYEEWSNWYEDPIEYRKQHGCSDRCDAAIIRINTRTGPVELPADAVVTVIHW